jgi:hypothetical protein
MTVGRYINDHRQDAILRIYNTNHLILPDYWLVASYGLFCGNHHLFALRLWTNWSDFINNPWFELGFQLVADRISTHYYLNQRLTKSFTNNRPETGLASNPYTLACAWFGNSSERVEFAIGQMCLFSCWLAWKNRWLPTYSQHPSHSTLSWCIDCSGWTSSCFMFFSGEFRWCAEIIGSDHLLWDYPTLVLLRFQSR